MKTNKPQLTISLLASNRPDTLRRCLDSLRPIREALSCELILIDTSKNPKINEMLLEYTEQVYEFDWCNDFAKARNEGIKRATGEWFLFLDDDEWFVETDALIEFFQSREYQKYGYANYQVRNFRDATYSVYSDDWITRLVRLEKETKFVSRIHEYLTPLKGRRKDLDVMIYHSGYIYETMEALQAHFKRNTKLLLEVIEEEPNNVRWYTLLAQEYHYAGEWEQLENFSKKTLTYFKRYIGAYDSLHMGAFFVGLAASLISQKKYNECIVFCKQILAEKRKAELLNAFMHLKSAECYLRLEQWDDAIEQVNIYLQMLHFIDFENPMIMEQNFIPIVCDVFSSNYQIMAYSILICSELEKGSTKALWEYYDKLKWKQPVVYRIDAIEQYLVKAMWTLPYEPVFAMLMVDALKNRPLRELFYKAVLEQETTEPSEFQTILYLFFQSVKAVADGQQADDWIRYETILRGYVEVACRWCEFVEEQGLTLSDTNELPKYLLAAVKISDYFELCQQDIIQALGRLKEAVELIPEFADGIGTFLQCYTELEKQRAQKQRAEMEALRVQVIGQVKAMMESGQMAAAAQIVGQLRQMFPGDEEVEALSKQIQLK